jgi:hypothetical protein
MSFPKRKTGRPAFPFKVMLSLSRETYERLKREAEETQSSIAGIARAMIARQHSQEAKSHPAEREQREHAA